MINMCIAFAQNPQFSHMLVARLSRSDLGMMIKERIQNGHFLCIPESTMVLFIYLMKPS